MRKLANLTAAAASGGSPLLLSSRWEVINGQSNLPTQVACNSLMGV